MAQLQVNLEGVAVTVEHRRIPLDQLRLDEDNPRIGLYRDSRLKATLSSEDIQHAIVNRNPDFCLYLAMTQTGQLFQSPNRIAFLLTKNIEVPRPLVRIPLGDASKMCFKADEVDLGVLDSDGQEVRGDVFPGVTRWMLFCEFPIDQDPCIPFDHQVFPLLCRSHPDRIDDPFVDLN